MPVITILKLSKKITSIDAALCEGVSSAFLSEDLKFNISRRDERSTEDFSGKFFVKIKIDTSLIDVVSTVDLCLTKFTFGALKIQAIFMTYIKYIQVFC